jgi:hypothetical protein
MAKIKFGMMMTDARGKLGGQVFSKNRNGAYVRTKVTPTNPRTAEQQAGRGLLGALSQGWSALDDTQRATFNEAVGSWARTNIFGDTINPTGKNLFVQLNKNAISAGFSAIQNAPAKVEMETLGEVTAVIDIAGTTIEFTSTSAIENGQLQVRATPQLTQGTSFVKGKFRDISSAVDQFPQATAIWTDYTARFGAPVAGANIVFEVVLTKANGQKSVPVNVKATFV